MTSHFERGQLVQYQFHTGCMGLRTLYGIVTKAGARTATIKWESGRVNRIKQGWQEVIIARDQNDACEAMIKAGYLEKHRAGAA